MSRLAKVVKGIVTKPVRVVMYSPEGLGKSTWASQAPDPIFIAPEDGTSHLNVERMVIETWSDIMESLAELETAPHGYRTAVLDTADWAEPLLWHSVCAAHGKANIEDFGFGKGYVHALDGWRKLCASLDRLRNLRSMNAIVLAHCHIRKFDNPAGENYDRYELKMHARASQLLKEWCDAVLFANYETLIVQKDGKPAKGVSNGERVIYTNRTAAWDAKNRYSLPEQLPLSWTAFAAAVAAHAMPSDAVSLEGRIESLLSKADQGVVTRVRDAVKRASGSVPELTKIASYLQAQEGV